MDSNKKIFLIILAIFILAAGCGDQKSKGGSETASAVELSPSSATVKVGVKKQFVATARDSSGNAMENVVFTWTSNDENIAAVDSNGLANGVNPGNAVIKASYGGLSGAASLTVESIAASNLKFNWTSGCFMYLYVIEGNQEQTDLSTYSPSYIWMIISDAYGESKISSPVTYGAIPQGAALYQYDSKPLDGSQTYTLVLETQAHQYFKKAFKGDDSTVITNATGDACPGGG